MNSRSGFGYFLMGFSLIQQKGLGRYVLVPLLVNIVIFLFAIYFVVEQFSDYYHYIATLIPEGLGWLTILINFVLWPMTIVLFILVFAMFFGTLANWIAAPFNGLLAAKTEQLLRGQSGNEEGIIDVIKDVPRTIHREWQKLTWYLPRALGFLLLLMFVPVLGQMGWFFFGAWMMSIQYCDYPFDNHKVPFDNMRLSLREKKGLTLSFGTAANVMSMIPILNFLVMPVAVCGATAMWVENYTNSN